MKKMCAGMAGIAKRPRRKTHLSTVPVVRIVELMLIVGLVVLAVQFTGSTPAQPLVTRSSDINTANQQTWPIWESTTDPTADGTGTQTQSAAASESSQNPSLISGTLDSSNSPGQQQTTQLLPTAGWQVFSEGADRCTDANQGGGIYCAPGKTATWYLATSNGTTIKSYYEINGLDQGAVDGVTMSYQLVSASRLRVQLTSTQAHIPFGAHVMIVVNESTSPQQRVHFTGWFQYNDFCAMNPPHNGCAQ